MTASLLPQHIAVVMDGNGRWAEKRHMPRLIGHKKGIEATRRLVNLCGNHGIPYLTLFAFSTENWKRPQNEVEQLMGLMMDGLKKEVPSLHRNSVVIRFVGNTQNFPEKMFDAIQSAEELTANNSGMTLSICVDYGGRWDITQAVNKALKESLGNNQPTQLSESDISKHLAMRDIPDPDLFIRTSGEQRISNFLLWQLAYTELHFTPRLWPDFNKEDFDKALHDFSHRERRFGKSHS